MAAMTNAPPLAELMPVGVSIYYTEPGQCVAWYRNVQLILSLQPPNRSLMRQLVDGLSALERTTRQRPGTLLIIRGDVKPPEEEVRDLIRTELMRSRMSAAAQVVEGSGFRGAAIRSALSMIQLAMRSPFPMRVFGDLATACDWLTVELKWRDAMDSQGRSLGQVAAEVRTAFSSLNPSEGM